MSKHNTGQDGAEFLTGKRIALFGTDLISRLSTEIYDGSLSGPAMCYQCRNAVGASGRPVRTNSVKPYGNRAENECTAFKLG